MAKLTLEFNKDEYELFEEQLKFGQHGLAAYTRLWEILQGLRSIKKHGYDTYNGNIFESADELADLIFEHIDEDCIMDVYT